jgi:hypothetical protein
MKQFLSIILGIFIGVIGGLGSAVFFTILSSWLLAILTSALLLVLLGVLIRKNETVFKSYILGLLVFILFFLYVVLTGKLHISP